MSSWFRTLLVAAVAAGLACKGDKGDPGAQGEVGPPGDPGVAFATAPITLSGASNATVGIARASDTTDGYVAAADFRALRSTGGGNMLDWKSDLARWRNTCGFNPPVTLATDSQEGDSSFEFNVATPNAAGSCEEFGELIEIDPTYSYSGQVWAKLVGGAGGFYAGFATYDASKTLIDNRYFIANNAPLSVGNWVQLVGTISGVGAGNNAFPANARFARPIVNPNFNNIGVTRVDGLKIFEGARRLPTLYRQGITVASQVLPNTDNSCGTTANSPWTTLTGMTVNLSLPTPTEIELNFAGAMGDAVGRTEGLHCALRYLIDGAVLPGADVNFGHYAWSTNTYLWHGIGARRRALVGAGNHNVTVQARSGLCGTPGGSDTGYCVVESNLGLGLFLEVVVP